MISTIFFIFTFVLIPSPLLGSGIAGGLREIPVDSPEVKRLTEFALSGLTEQKGNKNFIEVVKATVQVVAGTLTRLTLRLGENGEEMICEVGVWERPWLNKTEITTVDCKEAGKKRSKRRDPLSTATDKYHVELFNNFIRKYEKSYSDEAEFDKRFRIFRANLKKIDLLRETEQGTGEYGPTFFADLSSKEFKKYLGFKRPQQPDDLPKAEIPDIALPNEFDWRDRNVVTPVKNQGPCGSCWAFSVTGNIEGQWALKNGELISLSEQELIDCDGTDHGCLGGYMTNAYKAIVNMGGLETEGDYPYKAENEKCHINRSEIAVRILGGVNITDDEEGMAKWLVKNGPMSVALNANAMQFYLGGVSHPLKFLCSPNNLDHGVLIVGFGVRHSKILNRTIPYWIVKNSWGKHWGELGYYRIYRGDGTCGINQMVSSAQL